ARVPAPDSCAVFFMRCACARTSDQFFSAQAIWMSCRSAWLVSSRLASSSAATALSSLTKRKTCTPMARHSSAVGNAPAVMNWKCGAAAPGAAGTGEAGCGGRGETPRAETTAVVMESGNDTVLAREVDKFDQGAHAQLGHQPRLVCADRFVADEQGFADGFVAHAAGQQFRDGDFAVGQ